MSWSFWRKEEKAISALVEEHGPYLLAYLKGKTGSRIVSEDMAQEIWIKFFRQSEKIENNRAFLFTIANRMIIDYYRTKKQQSDLSALVNSKDFSTSETDALLINKEEFDQLRAILAEDELAILKLSMEGYSDEEISKKLDKKKKTVANKKSMLKKKIQKFWEDEQG